MSVPFELTGDLRNRVASILEDIARNGLPQPRDLDVALDAIESDIREAGWVYSG